MTQENWRPVVGYEGLYEVSDRGRIKSLGNRFVGDRAEARIRDIKPNPVSGYVRVTLVMAGHRKTAGAHALVLAAFVGPRPDGMEPRHLDGKRANNLLSNLAWGTKSQNYDDRRRHGTHNDGERHGRAKITESDVKEIRRKYATGGYFQKDLAVEYGIVQSKISAAIRRETWDHVL